MKALSLENELTSCAEKHYTKKQYKFSLMSEYQKLYKSFSKIRLFKILEESLKYKAVAIDSAHSELITRGSQKMK